MVLHSGVAEIRLPKLLTDIFRSIFTLRRPAFDRWPEGFEIVHSNRRPTDPNILRGPSLAESEQEFDTGCVTWKHARRAEPSRCLNSISGNAAPTRTPLARYVL